MAGSDGAIERPAQARANRAFRVVLTGFLAGLGLIAAAALLVPWLTDLDESRAVVVRAYAVALGASVALAVALLGPSGEPPGARLATRVGTIASITGTAVSLFGGGLALALAAPLGVPFDRATIASLVAGGIGVSYVVSVLASLVVAVGSARNPLPSAGVPLRTMIAGAAGTVTIATWALATAHLIGHIQSVNRQAAIDEARDLAAFLEPLPIVELERIAGQLAREDGFVGRVDADDLVLPGMTAGLPPDAHLTIVEGPPTLCRASRTSRALPCATRALPDGSRVVVAVREPGMPLRQLVLFVLIGIGAGAVAFGIGATLSRGPADDLNRVATVLDELGRTGQGGLDRPIPAVSLDEVGDLAVALARLRAHLRPSLVEHDEALERARAADRERDQFLALVSEELRAPLDRILESSRLLLEGQEPLTPSQREDIRLIVSSSTHLTELIEEVLDLSAIATGQIKLRRGEVDLGALATDVVRAQRPLLGQRPVSLQLDLPSGEVRVDADERRLRQVLTNLVSNAVKFTTEGSITIAIAREPTAIVLSVADTGPGIPAEQLPKLFSEFVQLGTLRQRARGTGLGLAICRRLIDAHQGRITAESEVGKGTRFIVRLPLSTEAAT